MKNKRSQVYGLSAFIYAIAIAIILIIGLIGLSKEYDLKSAAGLYRFDSVLTTKTAEILKKIMDQERGYAVDKSLFITGAFGGYSPDVDLINGCDSSCNSYYCAPGCFPNVKGVSGTCGAIINDIPYMGEKIVPRWNYYGTICTPSIDYMISKTFMEFASQRFVNPSDLLINAMSAATQSQLNLQYQMQLNSVNDTSGVIETSWYSPSQADIVLKTPADNPIIEYSFKPFVHIYSNTSFFKIYRAAALFAEQSTLGNLLLSNPTVVPTIIDEPDKESLRPFIALVSYSKTLPNTPNSCPDSDLDLSKVSAEFSEDCTVHVVTNSGQLIIDSYSGTCSNGNSDDKVALKCVMARVVNNINQKINLGQIQLTPPGSNDIGWRYTLKNFDLRFHGTYSQPGQESDYMSSYEYNTTEPGVFPGSCTTNAYETVDTPFAVDAWVYTGWGDCSSQSGGLSNADAFCVCKGYSGTFSDNPCYHEYVDYRWSWPTQFDCNAPDVKGTSTAAGIAFTQIRCKI
jgi:hypothetical protein